VNHSLVYWVDCAPGMRRRFLACEARVAVTYKRSGWRRLILETESSELAGVEKYMPYKRHTATHVAAESGECRVGCRWRVGLRAEVGRWLGADYCRYVVV
jgi:hypothetical protein